MIKDAQQLLAQIDVLIAELEKNGAAIAQANNVTPADVSMASESLRKRRATLKEQIAGFNDQLFIAATTVAGYWKRVMPSSQHHLADGIMMARYAENMAWCSSSVCPDPEKFGAKFRAELSPLRGPLWTNPGPVNI